MEERWLVSLVLTAVVSSGVAAGVAQQPARVPFRSGVTLVPIDVAVLDTKGRPVPDLAVSDFALFENDVRQEIAQFSRRAYSDDQPERLPRTFFVVLGRGRLDGTKTALDAIISFVGSRLLPGDRVGVMACLHLVEPTADRASVVRLLERYKLRHAAVEDLLARDGARGTGAPSWALSRDTQAEIEALLHAPELPPVQRFPGGAGGSGLRFRDHNYLITSLEYLRHLDGEKHLLLVSERPLTGGEFYAPRAASARTSVSLFLTGGVPAARLPTGRLGGTVPTWGPPVGTGAADARALAEETGGLSFYYQDPEAALGRLALAVSHRYILGYYPASDLHEGEHRTVRVRVNRRGLTLLYRHGHAALPQVARPLNLREIFVSSALMALSGMPATTLPGAAPHANIPLALAAVRTAGPGGATQANVDVKIDASHLTFSQEGDEYSAAVDLAAFVRGPHGQLLGEQRTHVECKVDEAGFLQLKRDGVRHRFQVLVAGRAQRVVVAVYEYESGRGAWGVTTVR
jgi:VWFA-related protein